MITVTLSAADGAAHLIRNPLAPLWLNQPITVTIILLLVLGVVFLKGFGDAIALAVVIVVVYMTIYIGGSLRQASPRSCWRSDLSEGNGDGGANGITRRNGETEDLFHDPFQKKLRSSVSPCKTVPSASSVAYWFGEP